MKSLIGIVFLLSSLSLYAKSTCYCVEFTDSNRDDLKKGRAFVVSTGENNENKFLFLKIKQYQYTQKVYFLSEINNEAGKYAAYEIGIKNGLVTYSQDGPQYELSPTTEDRFKLSRTNVKGDSNGTLQLNFFLDPGCKDKVIKASKGFYGDDEEVEISTINSERGQYLYSNVQGSTNFILSQISPYIYAARKSELNNLGRINGRNLSTIYFFTKEYSWLGVSSIYINEANAGSTSLEQQ